MQNYMSHLHQFLPTRRLASADTSYGPGTVSGFVCVSQITSRSSIETAGRIKQVFGTGTFFRLSYTVLKGNLDISKNKGTSM